MSKLEGEALIQRLRDNVQTWMEESFRWGKKSREDRAESDKLKALILLVDPAVSSECMNPLSAKQWAEFTRWQEARQAIQVTTKGDENAGRHREVLAGPSAEAGETAPAAGPSSGPHELLQSNLGSGSGGIPARTEDAAVVSSKADKLTDK